MVGEASFAAAVLKSSVSGAVFSRYPFLPIHLFSVPV